MFILGHAGQKSNPSTEFQVQWRDLISETNEKKKASTSDLHMDPHGWERTPQLLEQETENNSLGSGKGNAS